MLSLDTKVLTDKGLKHVNNVNIEHDLFTTLNIDSHEVFYQKANSIELKHSDKLYRIHRDGNTLDVLLTSGHQLLTKKRSGSKLGDWRLESIEKVSKKAVAIIPQTTNGNPNGNQQDLFTLPKIHYSWSDRDRLITKPEIKISMDIWLQFLGILVTDGCVTFNEEKRSYNVSISQKKKKFLSEIITMLDQMPFKFKFDGRRDYYTVNKQLTQYLQQIGKKDKKKLPEFVFNLSRPQKELLIDWCYKGDGDYDKNGRKRQIVTISKTFRDQLIRLLVDCGYSFSIYTTEPKDGKITVEDEEIEFSRNYPSYRVHIKSSRNYAIRPHEISKIPYKGRIYSIDIPTNIILTERKGRFTWMGAS